MVDRSEEIVELQTRLQFQDDVLQKLDEVVIKQGQLLDRMMRRMAALEERLEQLVFERDNPAARFEPKPPHY
ncbi:MAG: SlyX family protein [Gammaproteobacteria bacterium]|nr:SlyX family protein [Pseudomonadales bacterium]MCP5348096.1 SlyX family protein [Pseudomonadales bacterium]